MRYIPQDDVWTADIDKFIAWSKTAEPNSRFVYHSGIGLYDTFMSAQMKKITWDYACEGVIYLVQRRLGVDKYNYVAVKASKPHNPNLVPLPDPRPMLSRMAKLIERVE